jgi:hypothetical protein
LLRQVTFAVVPRRRRTACAADQHGSRQADAALDNRIEAEAKAPRAAILYLIKTWPDDFGGAGRQASYIKAVDAKVSRARRKGMLEGRGNALQLTDKAMAVLEGRTPS